MIRAITSLLNQSVVAMPVGRRVAFAEIIDGAPSEHTSGDQFTPIVADANGGVSYWRADGVSSVETLDRDAACGNAVRVSVPIALVAFVRRSDCDDLQGLLSIAANQLRASMRPLRNSIAGAFGASVSGIKLGIDTVRTKEVASFVVPASLAVLTLTFVAHIDASDECLDPCGEPYDLLCTLVARASNAKVEECLGSERIAEICDSASCPTLCEQLAADTDPITSSACITDANAPAVGNQMLLRDSYTPDLITEGIGNAGKTDEVCALLCPDTPCDPLTVTINGVDMDPVDDPCGAALPLTVVNSEDTPVGSAIDGAKWLAPDADWTLKDTEGNVLDTGSIPSGGSDDIIAPDGHATVNGVPYIDVKSGQTQEVEVVDTDEVIVGSLIGSQWVIADSTVQRKDSGGGDIGSPIPITAEDSVVATCPDATVQLKDSAGTNIGSADSYLSNSSNNKTAPDGTVTINNSVPTLLHTVAVKSNGSATQAIADSTITKPDGTTVGLPATVALDVRTYKSGIVYQFGYGLWSGETTAYRTGGEGYLYAQGWFDYARPAYPESFAALAGAFGTLAANNIYGNTRRFTDRAGAAPATSGDRYIRDHLTGCEWWRPSSMPSFTKWSNAVDNSAGATDGGETDWWLPPIKVLNTIADNSLADPFNYGGFLVTDSLWSSTTNGASTAYAIRMLGSSSAGPQIGSLKTSTYCYLFVRKFL